MRRLDRAGRIDFVDVAKDNFGEGTSCAVDRAELLAKFHALEGGQVRSGAAAFAAMWRAIPLLWPLGQAARIPMVLRLLDWAYARFLRIRPRLQRWLA